MKTTKFSRVLAVVLTIAMLAGSFGMLAVGAEDTVVKTPASKIDVLFTEEGYGFEHFEGDAANDADTRDAVYANSGLYYQPNAKAAIKSYTKDAGGKLVYDAAGEDQKLFLNWDAGFVFANPQIVGAGTAGLEESRYLTDILCSDAGYSKYTLEMDVAIHSDFFGTGDANQYDVSPFRGFTLMRLFTTGWTIKATGQNIGNSITYESTPYIEDTEGSEADIVYKDTYTQSEDGNFYKVTSFDKSNAVEGQGYFYINGCDSAYIMDDPLDPDFGTKCAAQKDTTFDTTSCIDFNKITAKGYDLVPYQKGVEQTLRFDFEATSVAGKNNDIYNVTIHCGDKLLGKTSYTATVGAQTAGIALVDLGGTQVTVDNIKLSVDTTSEFRCCYTWDYIAQGEEWSDNYWRTAILENAVSDISNTYNGFSAKMGCESCEEWYYAAVDKVIANMLVDLADGKSYTIKDTQSIVTGNGEYWVANDIHTQSFYAAPSEEKALINIGGIDVLKLGTDGKFILSDGTATDIVPVAKNSYSVAVRVIPSIGRYQLYVDSKLVGSCEFKAATNTITLNSIEGIRLLNNKAATLAPAKDTTAAEIRSLMSPELTYCKEHKQSDGTKLTFHKFPKNKITSIVNNSSEEFDTLVSNDMAYSFICADCGQRAYVELGENLLQFAKFHASTSASMYNDHTIKPSGSDNSFYLYAPSTTFHSGSETFWLSFDFSVIGDVTKVNDKNLFNFTGSYDSPFRFYYNETDGSFIGNRGNSGKKITQIESNTTYKFAIKFTPGKEMVVFLDGNDIYTYSGSKGITVTGTTGEIRFGQRGSILISNIALVKDAHSCAAIGSEFTAVEQGCDTLGLKHICCGTETATVNQINNTILDNIQNVSDGVETIEFAPEDDYWFATDINIRKADKDGALLTLGSDKILEIADGKLVSGTNIGDTVTAPTTYSVAARINGTKYDLYIEGDYFTSGTLSAADASTLTLGCSDFGYNVRFNYNKLVTLGNEEAVVPTFTEDKVGTVCYHIGTEKKYEDFSTALVDEATHGGASDSTNKVNLLYTTYICGGCGERVYNAEQGNNIYNSANTGDKVTDIQDGAFTINGEHYIYPDASFIADTKADYWINFSFKMNAINTERPRTNSSSAANAGEANFFNIMKDYQSLLRVYTVPNTVNQSTPMSYFQTSGEHFKITEAETCSTDYLLLRSRRVDKNIALLYVGAEYDISIHAVNGKADIYLDNELIIEDAPFAFASGGTSYRFFDQSSGQYAFSNFAFVEDADAYVDLDGMDVIEAEVTHTAVADATTYTDVITVDGTSLLSIADASGELVIPNGDGTYTNLYDKSSEKIVIGTDAVKVAVVNNNGKFNYYVNESLVRTAVQAEGEDAVFAQGKEFAVTAGKHEVEVGDGVTVTGNYGIGGTGTAEYIGEQLRKEAEVFQNQIRIVAGLNSRYYGNVGFKVTNKTTNKEITELSTDNTVYSSLLADDEKVYATDYGYNYFSMFEITNINMDKNDSHVISIIPYTTIGNKISYGEEKIITITIFGNQLTIK